MITLETGLPGAGKTLYCVDKLLRPLVGQSIVHEGVTYPRTIFTNINGLLLDHVKIGPGADWEFKGGQWVQPDGDKLGLANWHQWAKPGSVIVFDEVQKPWPLAATGSRVPPMIEALETHRHMGVDFIVLTQHPMLVHANLTRLVGRHLHVRRMGNMGLAVVYEWDGCSRSLLYKNCLAKGPYRYDKSVFDLYKSAELHTKSPRKVPALFWGIGLALGGLAWFGPVAYSRIQDRFNPQASAVSQAAASLPGVGASSPRASASAAFVATVPIANPVIAASAPVAFPVQSMPLAGCARIGLRCECFDARGGAVPVAPEVCAESTGVGRPAPPEIPGNVPTFGAVPPVGEHVETLQWMKAHPFADRAVLRGIGRE